MTFKVHIIQRIFLGKGTISKDNDSAPPTPTVQYLYMYIKISCILIYINFLLVHISYFTNGSVRFRIVEDCCMYLIGCWKLTDFVYLCIYITYKRYCDVLDFIAGEEADFSNC